MVDSVVSRALSCTWTSWPSSNTTSPVLVCRTLWLNVAFRLTACRAARLAPSKRCWSTYAVWIVMSCWEGSVVEVESGVCAVLTTKPSRSSFGENCSDGMMRSLSCQMAASKWSGHVLVMFSGFACSLLSSPRLGLQSRFRRPSSFPLAFSTNPLIHGVYAATTWCVVFCASHHACTSPLLKWEPPSIMNVSGGWNVWAMVLSPSRVVLAVPLVLNLKPHVYWEYVLRISKTVWYPFFPLGNDR